jgi:hypothetical protein
LLVYYFAVFEGRDSRRAKSEGLMHPQPVSKSALDVWIG